MIFKTKYQIRPMQRPTDSAWSWAIYLFFRGCQVSRVTEPVGPNTYPFFIYKYISIFTLHHRAWATHLFVHLYRLYGSHFLTFNAPFVSPQAAPPPFNSSISQVKNPHHFLSFLLQKWNPFILKKSSSFSFLPCMSLVFSSFIISSCLFFLVFHLMGFELFTLLYSVWKKRFFFCFSIRMNTLLFILMQWKIVLFSF